MKLKHSFPVGWHPGKEKILCLPASSAGIQYLKQRNQKHSRNMMNEPLSSIMTRNVITAGPNDKLSVAQEIFMSNRVHHLPVVDGRKLVGILTTYDMFKYHRNNGHHDGVLVKDVMTTHVATLEPE